MARLLRGQDDVKGKLPPLALKENGMEAWGWGGGGGVSVMKQASLKHKPETDAITWGILF